MSCKRIWLSWEKQRRTTTLAGEFSAKLIIHESERKGIARYLELLPKTLQTIRAERPNILFVQNPSIVLALFACLMSPFCKYTLIVDRHTNFKLAHRHSINLKWIGFHCASKLTNKMADAIIVTNKYLALLIRDQTKRTIILPDRLPSLPEKIERPTKISGLTALFICTYANDEPYEKVLEAAASFPYVLFYVTGNYKKAGVNIQPDNIPSNVILLGFVSDSDYFEHLLNSDFTIILTTQEFTLNCGSYESIAANKPMLLSNTSTIRNYFSSASVYTDPTSTEDLINSLQIITSNISRLTAETHSLKALLNKDWHVKKDRADELIQNIVNFRN